MNVLTSHTRTLPIVNSQKVALQSKNRGYHVPSRNITTRKQISQFSSALSYTIITACHITIMTFFHHIYKIQNCTIIISQTTIQHHISFQKQWIRYDFSHFCLIKIFHYIIHINQYKSLLAASLKRTIHVRFKKNLSQIATYQKFKYLYHIKHRICSIFYVY